MHNETDADAPLPCPAPGQYGSPQVNLPLQISDGNPSSPVSKKEAAKDELRQFLEQIRLYGAPSLIGSASHRGYRLRLSQADTIRLIQEHFEATGEKHRQWWIKKMVKGAREQAEKNERGGGCS